MDWRTSLRRKTGLALIVMGAVSLSIPALASANVVDDVLSSLGLGGPAGQNGNSGAPTPATPSSTKAGNPPSYVPPLHGTNPHGEGDGATIQIPLLNPITPNPVTGTPGQPETLVLGSSKGEQNPDGSYHGHINILSLFGTELLSVNSTPGQTNHSPVAALQTSVLDPLCTGSGGQLCLTLLQADSATTSNGSTNTFRAVGVHVGTGGNSIGADAVDSTGNISSDGTCQTATGTSSVAAANVLGAIQATAANGSSTSKACNNGTAPSTTQDSSVINLNGTGIPVPATGCDNGTPNTNFIVPLVISTVCNANDTSSGQATSPYGVREALTVFLVSLLGDPLVKATTAGPESRAAAPPATPTTTTPGGGNQGNKNKGNGNGNGNGGGNGEGNGSAASNAENGNGSLAFTGANLLWIAMLGLGLLGAGLAVAAVNPGARRPRLEA